MVKNAQFLRGCKLILLSIFLCIPITLIGGYNEESKVQAATEVLNDIMKIPETSIPPALMKNTYGVVVIPGVIKAGFVVGGRFGQGILVVRNDQSRWSSN
jgi:lipid-binding SYLF domain-containing protein